MAEELPISTEDSFKPRLSKKARRNQKKVQRLKPTDIVLKNSQNVKKKPISEKRKQLAIEMMKEFPTVDKIEYFEEIIKEMKLNSFDKNDIELKSKITTSLIQKQQEALNDVEEFSNDEDVNENDDKQKQPLQPKKQKQKQKQKPKQIANKINEKNQKIDKKDENENENENNDNEDKDEQENEKVEENDNHSATNENNQSKNLEKEHKNQKDYKNTLQKKDNVKDNIELQNDEENKVQSQTQRTKKPRKHKKNKQKTTSSSPTSDEDKNNTVDGKNVDQNINKKENESPTQQNETENKENIENQHNHENETKEEKKNNEKNAKQVEQNEQEEDQQEEDEQEDEEKEKEEEEIDEEEEEDDDVEEEEEEQEEEEEEDEKQEDQEEEEEEEDEQEAEEEEEEEEEEKEDDEEQDEKNDKDNHAVSKKINAKTDPQTLKTQQQHQPKAKDNKNKNNESKNKKQIVKSPRDLLLRDLQSFNPFSTNASSLLQQWVQQLSQSQHSEFAKMFDELKGVEIITERLLTRVINLHVSENNNEQVKHSTATRLSLNDMKCFDDIVALFDVTLQGSNSDHRWLVNEILALASNIIHCSTNKINELKNTLTDQLKRLINAQKKLRTNLTKPAIIPKQTIILPSNILTHERKKDPINDMFHKLDTIATKMAEIDHKLKSQHLSFQKNRPITSNDSLFQNEYRQIKNNLEQYDRQLGSKAAHTNEKLQQYQSQQRQTDAHHNTKIGPLQRSLNNMRNQQEHLKLQKSEHQRELLRIDNELNSIERDCTRVQEEIDNVTKQYFPESNNLKNVIDELTFESAAISREQGCYRQLQNIVTKSYEQLNNWSSVNNINQSDVQNTLSAQYLSLLMDCITSYAEVRQFLNKRLQHLRQSIDHIKQQNEQTRELLGPHSVSQVDNQITHFTECIDIDESINRAVLREIYSSLDHAKTIVGDKLFYEFILKVHERIGNIVDLSKYYNTALYIAQQSHLQQQQQRQDLRQASMITTNSIGTSTNGIFVVSNNNVNDNQLPQKQIIPRANNNINDIDSFQTNNRRLPLTTTTPTTTTTGPTNILNAGNRALQRPIPYVADNNINNDDNVIPNDYNNINVNINNNTNIIDSQANQKRKPKPAQNTTSTINNPIPMTSNTNIPSYYHSHNQPTNIGGGGTSWMKKNTNSTQSRSQKFEQK